MRKIYRDKNNSEYWDERWNSAGVDKSSFINKDMYPIKFAEMVIDAGIDQRILEAGCGAGRLFFHYKNNGKNIEGIEFSKIAVENILLKDPTAKVMQGSITDMPYPNEYFDAALAFGLYHNIEDITLVQKAFDETHRVLAKNGRLVASVRLDSLENNIIEYIVRRRKHGAPFDKFHRWHFTVEDIRNIIRDKFVIEKIFYVRNVSFLFKFNAFRSKEMKHEIFEESSARSEGFTLNFIGSCIDKTLHCLFRKNFSNLLLIIVRKK